jgi:hypothetical protein
LRWKNAIPTNFEPVGTKLEHLMASALPLSALCQCRVAHQEIGGSLIWQYDVHEPVTTL